MIPRIRAVFAAMLLLLLTGSGTVSASASGTGTGTASTPPTRTPIEHFVYLMQGDRTFDHYFGTYPGAEGLPAQARQAIDPKHPDDGLVAPYPLHDATPVSPGAGPRLVQQQYNGGRMDSFVAAFERQGRDGRVAMGHYDRRDLPFYWNAADRYELFDHYFASSLDGTRANRAQWVTDGPDLSGATLFDRLEEAGVSWKFYVQNYDPKKTYRTTSPPTRPRRRCACPSSTSRVSSTTRNSTPTSPISASTTGTWSAERCPRSRTSRRRARASGPRGRSPPGSGWCAS